MSDFVKVTVLVPVEDITIIDSKVELEKGDRHTPRGYDVNVWDIEVSGIDYRITDFDDSPELDNLAIKNWEEK